MNMGIKVAYPWTLRGHVMRVDSVRRFTEKVTPRKDYLKPSSFLNIFYRHFIFSILGCSLNSIIKYAKIFNLFFKGK